MFPIRYVSLNIWPLSDSTYITTTPATRNIRDGPHRCAVQLFSLETRGVFRFSGLAGKPLPQLFFRRNSRHRFQQAVNNNAGDGKDPQSRHLPLFTHHLHLDMQPTASHHPATSISASSTQPQRGPTTCTIRTGGS